MFYQNNPTFNENPLGANFFAGVPPIDDNLTTGGPQIRFVELNGETFSFLDIVDTLDASNDLEIRGAGAIAGQSTQGFGSLGGIGFNTPSLLGTGLSSPYLHDGSAVTLEEVFDVHTLPDEDGATINTVVSDSVTRQYLIDYVYSIDDQTPVINSF